MKDLEQNEKSYLLTSGNREYDRDDDDANPNTSFCRGTTFSKLRRWGFVSLLIVNVMVAIHYGFFTSENEKNGFKRNSIFHITPNKNRMYTKTQTLGFQIHTGGSPGMFFLIFFNILRF
jgi:hypothetical protein